MTHFYRTLVVRGIPRRKRARQMNPVSNPFLFSNKFGNSSDSPPTQVSTMPNWMTSFQMVTNDNLFILFIYLFQKFLVKDCVAQRLAMVPK